MTNDDRESPGAGSFPRSVTLRDVAERAGVSLSTAGRALSGQGRVSETTRKHVTAIAGELSYRPNPIAQAMRTPHTRTVGMVLPDISNPFFAELVRAVENALAEKNRELIVADSRDSVEVEGRRLASLVERRVDGIVLAPVDSVTSGGAFSITRARVPIVQIDRQVVGIEPTQLATDFVGRHDNAGIRLLVEHLREQGCATFAFVSGTATSSAGQSRLDAFRHVLSGRSRREITHTLLGSFDPEFGRAAAAELCAGRTFPDAVVCGSDVIALGLLRGLSDHGVHCPTDILVTGYDGIVFSELFEPPLTTLASPSEAMAHEAVYRLLRRIDGDTEPAHSSQISPTLVVRKSSIRETSSVRRRKSGRTR